MSLWFFDAPLRFLAPRIIEVNQADFEPMKTE